MFHIPMIEHIFLSFLLNLYPITLLFTVSFDLFNLLFSKPLYGQLLRQLEEGVSAGCLA